MATVRLSPTATTYDPGWTKQGASTIHECLDDPPGPPEQPDDGTTRIYGAWLTTQEYRCSADPMPAASVINSVTVCYRATRDPSATAGLRGLIRANGTSYFDTIRYPSTWTTYTKTWTTNPDTGLAWTRDEVNALEFGGTAEGESGYPKHYTMIFLEIDYTPLPAKIENARIVASQLLRLRRDLRTLEVSTRLGFLDQELLSDYSLSHFAGPAPDGAGYGVEPWQRRRLRLLRTEVDLESMKMKAIGLDLRSYLISGWDVGQSKISSDIVADGIARLYPGTRSFTRDSKAWIPDPSDGRIVQRAEDEEKLAQDGTLSEGGATNYVKNSSFDAGVLSSWSAIGSAVITEDTDNLLFDPTVTPRSANVAGNAGDGIQQPATVTVTDNILCFYFDYFGAGGTWDLKRSSDDYYWDDSGDGSWVASRPGNSFGSASSWTRIVSQPIDAPGGAVTLAVEFRLTSASTNFNLAHINLEHNSWPSSRIFVPSTTAVARANEMLSVTNNAGAPIYRTARGSGKIKVKVNWNSAEVTSLSGRLFCVCYLYLDANNYELVGYDPVQGYWFYQRKAGGNYYTATKTASVVRGTEYAIGWRWTGDAGELGLSNYTISVFVDGVKGSDAVAAASSTADSTLRIGSQYLSHWLEGAWRALEISPYVLTDEEMAQ